MSRSSEKISPTAYATGYFWYRHGLSHPALATARGRRLDRGLRLLLSGTRAVSGVSLTALMLARHQGIDGVLAQAIEDGRVGQVIELAAGLSPRGWRFARRYGERLTYLETDLPQMAALKRKRLGGAGLLDARHRVVELDALAESGPRSLAAVAATLDPRRGTAIVTEGLMNYLDPAAAAAVWRRIAQTLRSFPYGMYLSDFYLRRENRGVAMTAFGALLGAFVRGRLHVHFATAEQAQAAMRRAGFAEVRIHTTRELAATRELSATPGADRVRILEART